MSYTHTNMSCHTCEWGRMPFVLYLSILNGFLEGLRVRESLFSSAAIRWFDARNTRENDVVPWLLCQSCQRERHANRDTCICQTHKKKHKYISSTTSHDLKYSDTDASNSVLCQCQCQCLCQYLCLCLCLRRFMCHQTQKYSQTQTQTQVLIFNNIKWLEVFRHRRVERFVYVCVWVWSLNVSYTHIKNTSTCLQQHQMTWSIQTQTRRTLCLGQCLGLLSEYFIHTHKKHKYLSNNIKWLEVFRHRRV